MSTGYEEQGPAADAVVVPSPEGRRLDGRYRFERVAEVDPDRIADMWVGAGAMTAEQARERLEDVVLVAIEESDGVVGVSSAWLQDNPRLRMPVWNYRTFVAPAHRQGDIAFLLLHATRNELARRYSSGEDRRASGMLMEVQSEILKRTRNQGVWATSRFAFIGEDERGAHHRVFYFPGAEAPVRP